MENENRKREVAWHLSATVNMSTIAAMLCSVHTLCEWNNTTMSNSTVVLYMYTEQILCLKSFCGATMDQECKIS